MMRVGAILRQIVADARVLSGTCYCHHDERSHMSEGPRRCVACRCGAFRPVVLGRLG